MALYTRKGDRGIFDRLFAWFDSLRRESKYIYGLEEQIFAVEGALQDIEDNSIVDECTRLLAFWHDIIKTADNQDDAITAFQNNSILLLSILAHWNKDRSAEVLSDISALKPYPPEEWQDSANLSKEKYIRALRELSLTSMSLTDSVKLRFSQSLMAKLSGIKYSSSSGSMLSLVKDTFNSNYEYQFIFDTYARHKLTSRSQTLSELRKDCQFIWTITIRFTSEPLSASACAYTIWAISSALEIIDGVGVEFVDWGKGSFWAKLKVSIKNVWARDEVRESLDKGRKAAESFYLDRPIEDVAKTRAEKEKLEEEIRDIKLNRSERPDKALLEELRMIELEERREDLLAKKLENRIRSLDLVEKASNLVKDGIVSADGVEINVNDLLLFCCDGQNAQIGKDMKDIEEAGTNVTDDTSKE